METTSNAPPDGASKSLVSELSVTGDGVTVTLGWDPNELGYIALAIIYHPIETIGEPDHWKIRRYHHADIFRENLRECIDKYAPNPAIWETVISHPVLAYLLGIDEEEEVA